MKNFLPTLYLEIGKTNFTFFAGETDKHNNFKIIYKLNVPVEIMKENRFSDYEKAFTTIKENIYLVEQKLNYTFKEIIVLLNNFNPSFTNIAGYKKLNGSQILKENITYILNKLKSFVNEIETKKIILHIFNSKFYLDNKKIDNLPIGLFGDFYSHELSFSLINKNDFKNLQKIISNCNLKVSKILLKSFVKGASISDNNKNIETFFQIEIDQDNSKIFYFENFALKFEQSFNFGSNIVIKDISKITSLKTDTIKEFLKELTFDHEVSEDQIIEKKFFTNDVFKKVKKKLVHDIASARILEILEIILFKNINFSYYSKNNNNVFLEINNKLHLRSFREIYKQIFTFRDRYKINFLNSLDDEKILESANKIVHFGWKKEAIPITKPKKTFITRIFQQLFQ